METQHTQGDWTTFNNGNDEFNEIGILSDAPESDNGTFISSVKIYNEDGKRKYSEAIANAKLIVQSPKMHLFLTTFIEAMEHKNKKSVWEIAMLDQAKEILNVIQ